MRPAVRQILLANRRAILDLSPNPSVGGFGLRRLRNLYRGPACDVRRSSDNATLDIGLVGSGDFDVGTFNSFVGAGSGFVAKWYDQSGSGNDAVQATAANQPQLVLNAIGGRPALLFNGTSQYLSTASFASSTSPQSFAAVAERTGNTAALSMILSANNNNELGFVNSANKALVAATSVITAAAADNQAHSLIGVLNGASSIMTVDGADTTGTDGGDISASAALFIGADAPSTQLFAGYIAEAWTATNVVYSASQRAAIHANHKAYYGTP